MRIGIAAALAAVVLIFGVGQLVLPGLAVNAIRGRLGRGAGVSAISVHAVPAIELLFGDADRVSVDLRSYSAQPSRVASDLGAATGVANLSVHVRRLSSDLVDVDDVTVAKHGDVLTATGTITEAALRAAVPFLTSVTPVASSDGQVILQGTASAFGVSATADADLGAHDGKVTIGATGLLGDVLGTLTVWSNPAVDVEAISGHAVTGGLVLSVRARVR